MTPTWSETAPGPAEYVALRAAAGMGKRTESAARIALPNALHSVTVRDGGRLIAMGRVVGDAGSFVQLVDVAVAPDAQGIGLGREIVRRLMAWCEGELPACCHISLVSSARAERLYEAAGFARCLGMDRYAGPRPPA